MYRTIVHTANEGIWLVDPEARTIFVNDRMAAILGYTTEEMASFGVTDMAAPEYRQSAQTRFDRNLKGHFEQFDCRFRHKDGNIVYALGCTSPVRDGSNNIVGALGMFTDVTERQHLALALEERVSELEAIFEAVADGVLVFDHQGHILRTNNAYRVLMGLDDASGYFTATLDSRVDMLSIRDEHGQELPYTRLPVMRILRGEVLTGNNTAEIILRTLHGYDLQLNIAGTPMLDQEGNITGGVLVFNNITEHRWLERRTRNAIEALLEFSSELSEELAQPFEENAVANLRAEDSTTLDTIAQGLAPLICQSLGCEKVGIIVIEPDTGELCTIAFAGVTAQQEQQWRKRMSRGAFREQLQELQLDEKLRSDEILVVDLRQFPFYSHSDFDGMQKVILAPILLGKQLIGLLALDYGKQEDAYAQDCLQLFRSVAKRVAFSLQRCSLLTERAEARANKMALREANRLMDEFIGVAVHEIRTPLTTINASVQQANWQLSRLAERKAELPDDLAELAGQIHSLLDRAQHQIEMQNRLVSDILDVSKMRAHDPELLS
ncbi:MAG TPA: PAS domain S-box protein, partial [Ktedonobacteraceae bacterium]|nr:PAS domain S-box protein [Ktedonobacteraceae bacterium]